MSDESNVIEFPELDDNATDVAVQIPEYNFHTVLEVWRETLKPAAKLAETEKISPQWANKIVQKYPQIKYADCAEVHTRYYAKIETLLHILQLEIETDPECLNYTTPEEDSVENAQHYKQVMLDWQLQFLRWELEWDCTDDDAAVELATMGEVHTMFFGQMGLLPYLDNIKFQFDESDQMALHQALEAFRDAWPEAE